MKAHPTTPLIPARLLLPALCAAVALAIATAPPALAESPNVVISQVYGGGGNSGSTWTNDFVELLNRGVTPVDVTGWSVQYASATGSTWLPVTLSGVLAPGQYYLIQQAGGTVGTTPLPAPDLFGTTNMSATAGKVALVSASAPLSGTCPESAALVDLVGYGSTANCSEGFAALAPNAITAVLRQSNGCIDRDNNMIDFYVAEPVPRNSAWPNNECYVVSVDAATWGRIKSIYR